MEKSVEQLQAELSLAKDTLLNEVMHRQQLGAKLQEAADRMQNLQNIVVADMKAIRQTAKEKKYSEILKIIDKSIGPEPKEPEAPTATVAKAAE